MDGEIAGLFTSQDTVNICCREAKQFELVYTVDKKASGSGEIPPRINGRQPMLCGKSNDLSRFTVVKVSGVTMRP